MTLWGSIFVLPEGFHISFAEFTCEEVIFLTANPT